MTLLIIGCLLLVAINIVLTKRGDQKLMTDLTALVAKVDAIAAVVPNIQTDYETLKAEIEALKGQLEPDLQAKIDALTAKLGESVAALAAVDETVPVVPPPPPPPPAQ